MFFNKIILLLTCSFALVHASEHHEANELFHEAKCLRCHNTNDFHVREEKVNSFKKLNKQVQACASNTHAGWFEEEVHGVSRYLNHNYYKMPQPPAMEE
jgi:phage FluMu protein Com